MGLLDTSYIAEMNPVVASYIFGVPSSNIQESVTDEAIALGPNRLLTISD